MFDSTDGVYQGLFRYGAKRASIGGDRDWAFGRAAIPSRDSDLCNVATWASESPRPQAPRVGQLALRDLSDLCGSLREFGDRFLGHFQPLAVLPSFRENFRRQWFSGAAADGPLAQILLAAYADSEDGVLLIYDVSSWILVSTAAATPLRSKVNLLRKPLSLDRLPKRVALRLPPFSESLPLNVRKLRFAAPQVGSPSREDRFRIFGRTRASHGTIDFSEEVVAGLAIPGEGIEELNSLHGSFVGDLSGETRGKLNCRILMFACLPKTLERNPNVKTIRFILEPTTGEVHSIAYVRQSFLGFCEQTTGLRSAIGSVLTGVQL